MDRIECVVFRETLAFTLTHGVPPPLPLLATPEPEEDSECGRDCWRRSAALWCRGGCCRRGSTALGGDS